LGVEVLRCWPVRGKASARMPIPEEVWGEILEWR